MPKKTKPSTPKKREQVLEAAVIAKNFGFTIKHPQGVSKDDIKIVESHQTEKGYLNEKLFPMEEAFSLLKEYKERKQLANPALHYYEGSIPGGHKKHRKNTNYERINLHILNVEESIADILIIKTIQSILAEHGIRKIQVKINNIGDIESRQSYVKAAKSYYRKNINGLNNHCRQLFKENLRSLITKGKNECLAIHDEAPKPMEFLNEPARKKFSEILEYLETLEIPYQIDQNILGDLNYSTNTIFEFINEDTGEVVAAGTRYDSLARHCALRKDIPAVGATIKLPHPKKVSATSLTKIDKSKFFFLQIGFAAKLQSLVIIDKLRKNNIPTLHKLYRDKLNTQISAAQKTASDYFIILGQKEALEGSVIIRDKESRSQHIINQEDLVDYLKKL